MKSDMQLINETAQLIDSAAHSALRDSTITEYVGALRTIRGLAAEIARLTLKLEVK